MANREIKIGALYPLTGTHRYVGQTVKEALEFYVELVNNQKQMHIPAKLKLPYLDKTTIKLVWADTQGDPIIALAEAKRLIEHDGVTSIIGSYQTSVTSVVAFLTEMYEIPYLCPDADAGVLSQRGLKYFFKLGTDDTTYTDALFNMMQEYRLNGQSIGSLAENTLLGQGEVNSIILLSNHYNNHQMKILEMYNSSQQNLRLNLSRIQSANPDIIFAGQLSTDAVKTLRDLKNMNYYPKAIFDQTGEYTLYSVLEYASEDVDYVVSAVPWAVGVTKKMSLAKLINFMFKSKYGEDFNSVNAVSFTGIFVLIDAIARAYSDSPNEIRKALAETNISPDRIIMPWHGIRFNEDGKNIYATSLVVQRFNNELQIIWPKSFVETRLVYPVPPWNCR